VVAHAGDVRLLDFGIAKLLAEGQAQETQLTELGGRALTVDYASPEQILGRPLAVTSDVYSLGVVLYELSSGARPYRLKRDSRGALEDAILDADPRRPSEVAPAPDRRALRGDLDTIVLKALKKQPTDRYATVNALIEDLQRYQAGRPVAAQPDSAWYRTRKFVGRNAFAVAAAALVVASLIGGGLVAFLQAERARTEQRRAEAVKDFIVAMFERADPQMGGGQALSASQLVRQASEQVMAGDLQDPYARTEIARVLGTTLVRLRDIEAAERAARVALDEARTHFAADHIEVLRARLLMAQVMRFRSDFSGMRAELAAIRPLLEKARDSYPLDYLGAQAAQTNLEIEEVRYADALASAHAAVAIAERHFGRDSVEYAGTLRALSQAYVFAGEPDKGLESARQSFERLLAAHEGNTRHPQVIESRVILARVLGSSDAVQEAVVHSEAAIADAVAVYGADNTTVGYYTQQSVNHLLRAGRPRDALAAARRSFDILKRDAPRDSMTYVAAQNAIGKSLVAVDRAGEAQPVLEFVAGAAGRLFGPQHRNTFEARALHAFAVAEGGDIARARNLIRACLDAVGRADKPITTFPLAVHGQIERRAGNEEQAIRLLEQSLGTGSTIREEFQRAALMIEVGLARFALKQLDESRSILEEGFGKLQAIEHGSTPPAAHALLALSRIDAVQGRRAAALQYASRAVQFWQAFDATHAEAARATAWLHEIAGQGDK